MTAVFISYSSLDEEIAKSLYSAMSAAGVPTFLAGISIKPGERWTDVIFSNLEKSEWVFFLASKNSCMSHAVQQEIGASLIQKKTVIPVLIDILPEELPGWVGMHQAIDLKSSPELIHKTIEKISEKLNVDKFWIGLIFGAIVVGLILILSNKS